ncbi:MAG: DUF3847 domain-containing protein [Clostridiales bacterium]|nr:DUF3847 domain-containing protein [Clostridiales bacterium]
MFMNKTIEQLQAEKAKAERELAQTRHQDQRLKNRIAYYTEGERKKRNHRLITRGAAVESVAPEVKGMGEADFYSLAEKIFSLPAVKAMLPEWNGGDV